MNLPAHHFSKPHIFLTAGLIVVVGGLGYLTYQGYLFVEQSKQNSIAYASSTIDLQTRLQDLDNRLSYVITQSSLLTDNFQTEKSKNTAVQEQIGKIYDTVGTLDKLSKTDPQLLQKYSKVYFLNEHYAPPQLTAIPPKYLFNKESNFQIHFQVFPYLTRMIDAAATEGVDLQVISAYRSFKTQGILKSSYKVTYGAGTANQFSADQGYSEHQLGTTLDFTTGSVGSTFTGFDKTATFVWLQNNASKYGFTLSYPQNNKYYEYEPWHWRFVGVDLASRLQREGKYFYDLDQRVIDNYLLVIFN